MDTVTQQLDLFAPNVTVRTEYGVATTHPETGQPCVSAMTNGTRREAEVCVATIHRWRGPHTPAQIVVRTVYETDWEPA